jgi:hypothetical protein
MKKITALLLAAALTLGLTACGQDAFTNGATGPINDTTPTGSTQPSTPNNSNTPTPPSAPIAPEKLADIYKISNYTGSAEDVIANRNVVVATMNGVPLNNSTLQIYYWLDVYDFISNFDITSYGLDLSKPLHSQNIVTTSNTWQHYFLGSALSTWHYHQALSILAQEENISLLPYFQKLMDNMDQELTDSAVEGGFDSIDAMIQSDVGPGCTIEDYRTHRQILYAAQNYCYYKINSMAFTDQQIEDYYTEHEASLKADGIKKNLGNAHRVRHILLPIGKDATDADWKKLRSDAQTLLDQWLAGEATEKSFSALAMEKSEDPGSVNYGGLYQGLTDSTSFLAPFKDWYLDESRQVGDYGLVKTTAGYHVMYYAGQEPIWYYYCREMMVSNEMEKIENAAMEKYDVVINFDKILLGEVSLMEDK